VLRREQVAVGITLLYEKPARLERGGAEALLRHRVERVEHVLQELEPTAAVITELCQGRWDIEGAVQDPTVILQCEPTALGYSPAALFAFCLAVIAYNVPHLTRAALGAAHGAEQIEREVSSYDRA